MLGFLLRTTKMFKHPETYFTLYNAFVRSQLEYAVVVWNPLYSKYSDKIESIQRRFLRALQHRVGHPNISYDASLCEYGVYTLDNRRSFLELMVLYNICHSHYHCPELLMQIGLHVPNRVTRSCPLFSVARSRTNAGVRAPLRRMCLRYNRDMSSLDILAHARPLYRAGVKAILCIMHAQCASASA